MFPASSFQFTEAKILSEFIKTDAHKLAVAARPPMAVTNAVSWRQEGLFYKKNEVGCNSVCVLAIAAQGACAGRSWASNVGRGSNVGRCQQQHIAIWPLPAALPHCPLPSGIP